MQSCFKNKKIMGMAFMEISIIMFFVSIISFPAKSQNEAVNIISSHVTPIVDTLNKKQHHRKNDSNPYNQSMWSISRKGIHKTDSATKKCNK
jgi:hypothetical protein